MKKYLSAFFFLFTVITWGAVAFGQNTGIPSQIPNRTQLRFPNESAQGIAKPKDTRARTEAFPSAPLSSAISLPGITFTPVSGTFPLQSNGKALHNIQVDPSNPLNIHAVIVSATDPSENDTASPGAVTTRRCFYTFSADGGKNWKAPVVFSTTKTGYPDMKLMKRADGQYIPVIAAHKIFTKDGINPDSVKIGLWIETGAPGDGKFSENFASMHSAYGKNVDSVKNKIAQGGGIIWPALAFSPDYSTAYVIGSVSSPTVTPAIPDTAGLQFGSFSLASEAGTATFNGWTALPGSGDPTYDTAGATIGGEYRIAVSASGKIGVLWKNILDTAKGNALNGGSALFFAESYDQGKTWSKPLQPLVPIGPVDNTTFKGGRFLPSQYMDFWYNGEDPLFIYSGLYQIFGQSTWFPGSAAIYFFDSNSATGAIPVVGISSGLPNVVDPMPNAFFPQTDADGKSNTTIDPYQYNEDLVSFLTVARTTDPNHFAIFFQSYELGDTEVMDVISGGASDGSDSTVTYPFASLYYVETIDGGVTWGGVTLFQTNDDAITNGAGQHYDFRYPQVSDFNPVSGGQATYYTMFSVDTAAGYEYRWGLYGFDTIYYGFATTAPLSSVAKTSATSLSIPQSFPNPFASSTKINFTIADESNVVLTVEDVLGRPIATLVNGPLGPGDHSFTFNAGDLPNGVYSYTLRADGQTVSKSMSLIR